MKKILLTSLVVASSLMANCFNVKSIDSFMDGAMFLQCSKSMFPSSNVITTKIAGKEFGILLVKTLSWDASCLNTKNLKVSLIDLNDNNKTIATKTIGALSSMPMTPYLFKVDNAYKDVKVKIEYGTSGTKINRKEVTCPSSKKKNNGGFNLKNPSKSFSGYTTITNINDVNTAGKYYDNNKCYEVSLTPTSTSSHTEYSSDDFAIRPNKFDINFKRDKVFTGEFVPMSIEALGFANATDTPQITTNYSTNSDNLDISFVKSDGTPSSIGFMQTDGTIFYNPNHSSTTSGVRVQYYFELQNGKLAQYQLLFTRPDTEIKMDIVEKNGKEWAIVDADDTKDACRLVSGESNEINVTETSKSWIGFGTGAKSNDPSTKTIDTDIRQNVDKDIRFKRMNW
jgi:hypothetical protein